VKNEIVVYSETAEVGMMIVDRGRDTTYAVPPAQIRTGAR